MKPSRYNYYLERDDGKTLIFNGRTKRFFEVSRKNSDSFKRVIENPDECFEQYKRFLLRMRDEGFIVDDDVDELRLVKDAYHQETVSDNYMLLVFPTYQCNVRCWYCIQKHQDVVMTVETVRRLKLHIEKYLKKNHIKSFYLSWFGGEPMLEYDTIADVTSYAKVLCERLKVSFKSGITTNGILLNDERIKRFRELGIHHFQITIDGTREQHNRVKRLEGKSAFDTTLINIKRIVELMPEADCSLRINYTEKTDINKVMHDVGEVLPIESRQYITVIPRKVWQIDENKISEQAKRHLYDAIIDEKYKLDRCQQGICYVSHKHFATIYPNGAVGKCDNDDMLDAKGYIDSLGDIVWTGTYPFMDKPVYDDCCCSVCKHLPICGEPCPRMIDNMLHDYGEIKCAHKNPESMANDYICNYVKSFETK